jgi:hypothetical protein
LCEPDSVPGGGGRPSTGGTTGGGGVAPGTGNTPGAGGVVSTACHDRGDCVSVSSSLPQSGLCSGSLAVVAANQCGETVRVVIHALGCSTLDGADTLGPGETWDCSGGNYFFSSCTGVQYKAALATDPDSCTRF